MARERRPPTARLRRLASELLGLRNKTELSREEVQEQTGINQATLYKIEKAQAKPQPRTLKALLDLYQVTTEKRDMLMTLLREASQQTWLQPFQPGLPDQYNTLIGFESEARAVWTYETLIVPGLLQTEQYARSVIRGMLPNATEEEVEQRVTTRMQRQAVLDGLNLWAIVDEAALRRKVSNDGVMRAQIEHLQQANQRPGMTLQVLSFDAGPHPAMLGSFVILKFGEPGLTDMVYIEGLTSDLFFDDEPSIMRYTETFEHLRASAMSPTATDTFLAELASEL